MTAVISSQAFDRRRFTFGAQGYFWLLVVAGTAVSALMAAPQVAAVWSGAYGDPDDAMRMVEVRSWLAGQPWFDVSALRLDPPNGASMHWSRLVDMPNALLISVFGLFAGGDRGEALDRIVLPTLLLAAFFVGMLRLSTVLLGGSARLPALIGTVLCGVTLVQFQPGRIGHHAPETVALILAVTTMLESLDARYVRRAAVAGAFVALSITMSLETLPLLAAFCVSLVVAWIVRGPALAASLSWFAIGLGLALPLLFAATIGPTQWFDPVCDSLGMAYLGAGMIGAGGVFVLTAATPRLSRWPMRAIAAVCVGACVLAFLALAYPACLHSPFAGVDPIVRAIWLDKVVESKTLFDFMRDRPTTGVAISLPAALGLAGCLWATVRSAGMQRVRFAIVAAGSTTGFVAALLQVRVFASVAPIALCGGLFAAITLRDRIGRFAARLWPAAIVPFTSTAWALALPPGSSVPHLGAACLAPQALAPLAALPPGRIVAPIDIGSHLLVATPHTVMAAPYHRNNDGNRFALDVFSAPADKARVLLAARDIIYVVTCDGMGETQRLAARAPAGLAADLATGRIPNFLARVPIAATPYRIYAVRNWRG